MKKNKKAVKWKDTRTEPFYPEYSYPVSVSKRYLFFWTLGRHYRKTINYAAKFVSSNRICAVYVFGEVDKVERLKKYNQEVLVLHLPKAQQAIEVEQRYCDLLNRLKKAGLYDGNNFDQSWIEETNPSSPDYILWEQEHPKAISSIEKALKDGYDCYGLFEGKISGALDQHPIELERLAAKLYPSGIEFDSPSHKAYRSTTVKKTATMALDGSGAKTLNIKIADAAEQLSLFNDFSTSASNIVLNLKSWCDDEINKHGCFSFNKAWEVICNPPYGAYVCNWYTWLYFYVLREYVNQGYFAGDVVGNTWLLSQNKDHLSSAAVFLDENNPKHDIIIFKQNAQQNEFMQLILKLFDIKKPWGYTTASAIIQARFWVTQNIRFAPLDMIDSKLGEIFSKHIRSWYASGYEKSYLPWLKERFDVLYKAIRNADNTFESNLTQTYGKEQTKLYLKSHHVKNSVVGWLYSYNTVMKGVEQYMQSDKCMECGRKIGVFSAENCLFEKKDIIGLNKKIINREMDKYYCIPCMCEYLDCNAKHLHDLVARFKEEGCELFA